jgi:ferredoxin
MRLDDHPTVVKVRRDSAPPPPPSQLEAQWLRQVVPEAGGDETGFVEIARPELAEERPYVEAIFPAARTLISFVSRMNRQPVRSPARSLANVEFHHAGDRVNEIAGRVVAQLESRGVRAMNPAMGFLMEMARFPDGRIWPGRAQDRSEAAGVGKMGIHRNVIHPVFGGFILLGTVIIDAEVTEHATVLHYNPCVECKLCVAACPVGAIGDDGHFNRDYGDVFPRIAGMLMTGLGLSVFGMIRARTARLYPATLFIRVYLMVCIVVFYEATADPLFFVLIPLVALDFALRLTAHLVDKNTLATASPGPSTKPAQR